MRIAAVYSEGDPAGSGAASKLLELRRWRASSCARAVSCYLDESGAVLAGFREDVLYFDFLDEVLDADAYVVLSRHSSRSGRPSLTVHTTGNYADAQFGGRPRELAWSNPRLEGALLRAYASAARELGLTGRYWVGLEATHHGPTNLLRPITFIEVGSSPAEWSDGEAQMAMAVAVDSVLSSEPPACPAAAGFGGTHYPEKHTALVLRGEACYGHVLAKYALERPDPEVIAQAIDKNYGGVSMVVLERKSAGSAARAAVEEAARSRGLPVVSI